MNRNEFCSGGGDASRYHQNIMESAQRLANGNNEAQRIFALEEENENLKHLLNFAKPVLRSARYNLSRKCSMEKKKDVINAINDLLKEIK